MASVRNSVQCTAVETLSLWADCLPSWWLLEGGTNRDPVFKSVRSTQWAKISGAFSLFSKLLASGQQLFSLNQWRHFAFVGLKEQIKGIVWTRLRVSSWSETESGDSFLSTVNRRSRSRWLLQISKIRSFCLEVIQLLRIVRRFTARRQCYLRINLKAHWFQVQCARMLMLCKRRSSLYWAAIRSIRSSSGEFRCSMGASGISSDLSLNELTYWLISYQNLICLRIFSIKCPIWRNWIVISKKLIFHQ